MSVNNPINTAGFDALMSHRLVASIDTQGNFQLADLDGKHYDAAQIITSLKQQRRLQSELAIVWVPTQQLVLTEVTVPGKRKSLWMAALPYALEESLSESVDEYHIVAMQRGSEDQVSVALTTHTKMQEWQAVLDEMGLHHAKLIPDCFRLPYVVNTHESHSLQSEWLWQSYDNECIKVVRTGLFSGFAADENWYAAIQQQQLAQRQALTTEMQLSIKEQNLNQQSLLASSQTNLAQVLKMNLSVGAYAPRSQSQNSWYEWRWVGLLGVMIIAVWLVAEVMQTRELNKQAQYTQAQTEALFIKMFPQTKRIVNIKAQTLTQLGESASGDNDVHELMPMLQLISPWFAQNSQVKLLELNWEAGKSALKLKVEAKKSSDLDKIIRLAENNALGFSMRLQLNNVTSELAEGVFYVDAN